MEKSEKKALYFIALIPPDPLKSKIAELKITFSEKFRSTHSLNSPPHVTLVPPFRANETKTEQLINNLEELVSTQSVFELFIKGSGAFKPRVIYLDIEKSKSADALRQALISRIMPNFSDTKSKLHITLASRDLSTDMFFKAWKVYKDLSFADSFLVDHVYLLKHDGKIWQIEREFQFENKFSEARKVK